ncbi:MAG TPA: HAD-IB family phosphatase [Bacteroidota bacterium]|nr:HAD-IB family phosphatase [Bacteroidota bacterium]
MVKIFVDFDGTITRGDVGDALFERFGGERSLRAVEAYRRGELSAMECYVEECLACGSVPLGELRDFLDSREIDPTFSVFAGYCRERSFGLTILSDGMDYYIRAILERHGLGHVPFRANVLSVPPAAEAGHVEFRPGFPHTDEVCDRCASCKRNHMLTTTAADDVIVYAGEGYSDRCPVQFADLVFAKDDLLRHCEENSVAYYPYATFNDVRDRLEKISPRGANGSAPAFPRRRRAAIARKDVFLGG